MDGVVQPAESDMLCSPLCSHDINAVLCCVLQTTDGTLLVCLPIPRPSSATGVSTDGVHAYTCMLTSLCVCGGGGGSCSRREMFRGVVVIGVVERPGDEDKKVTHVLVHTPSCREVGIRLPGKDGLLLLPVLHTLRAVQCPACLCLIVRVCLCRELEVIHARCVVLNTDGSCSC
jgi:hypothetical protein